MAVNKFLEFGSDCIDILSDEEYVENPTRSAGVQTGIASSTFHNKLFRQSSVMSASIGKVIADSGVDAGDESVEDLSDKIKTVFENKPTDEIAFDPTGTLLISTNVQDAIKEQLNYVEVVLDKDDWSASMYSSGGSFVNPDSDTYIGIPILQSITIPQNLFGKRYVSIKPVLGYHTVTPAYYPPINPIYYEKIEELKEFSKISFFSYSNVGEVHTITLQCYFSKPLIDLKIRIEGV